MARRGIPMDAFDSAEIDLRSPEERFQAGASIDEGVAGKARIDTTFENDEHPKQVTPSAGARPWGEFEDLGQAEDTYL